MEKLCMRFLVRFLFVVLGIWVAPLAYQEAVAATVSPCADGIDNDGNGFKDYPEDKGCTSATDTAESGWRPNQCADRKDNDGDGKVDYPADNGCYNANDNDERGSTSENSPAPTPTPTPTPTPKVVACVDGIDNDGNGFKDYPEDKGCSSATDTSESGYRLNQCADHKDNDSDGLIDYPTDPGCYNANDNSEGSSSSTKPPVPTPSTDISPTQVIFGPTYNVTPKTIQVLTPGAFSVSGAPAWLTANPLSSIGPARISLAVDVVKVPPKGDAVSLMIVTPNGTSILSVVAKCSSSSDCGEVPGSDDKNGRAEALPGFKSAPVRPTYRDVSIKIPRQESFKWFRGYVATQVLRDAMEETLAGIAVPEALRYARTIPSCETAMNKAMSSSGLNAITTKLGPIYEIAQALKDGDGGSWAIGGTQGRHYSIENYILSNVQACSIEANSASLCAKSTLMTPDLLDLLDMRVEGGKCVQGANFELVPPQEVYDNKRSQLGKVQAKTLMPELTEEQKRMLHATHMAHKQVSDWRCGIAPAPEAGIVKKRHLELEASAVNEEQHHFFRLKDFSGTPDPGWTQEEVCQWARLQDRAHENWMDAILAGKWGRARLFDNDHQQAHLCMTLKNDELLTLFSCEQEESVRDCPKRTCTEVLQDEFGGAAAETAPEEDKNSLLDM